MKKQLTITDNVARVEPLETKEIKRITLKPNQSKEYMTKSGCIVIVTKRVTFIQGVTLKPITFYEISDCGKIIKPLKSIGVLNYLEKN